MPVPHLYILWLIYCFCAWIVYFVCIVPYQYLDCWVCLRLPWLALSVSSMAYSVCVYYLCLVQSVCVFSNKFAMLVPYLHLLWLVCYTYASSVSFMARLLFLCLGCLLCLHCAVSVTRLFTLSIFALRLYLLYQDCPFRLRLCLCLHLRLHLLYLGCPFRLCLLWLAPFMTFVTCSVCIFCNLLCLRFSWFVSFLFADRKSVV